MRKLSWWRKTGVCFDSTWQLCARVGQWLVQKTWLEIPDMPLFGVPWIRHCQQQFFLPLPLVKNWKTFPVSLGWIPADSRDWTVPHRQNGSAQIGSKRKKDCGLQTSDESFCVFDRKSYRALWGVNLSVWPDWVGSVCIIGIIQSRSRLFATLPSSE